MSTKPSDPFTPFFGPGAEAFKLWISFFPTAPLFGVPWRFADQMPFDPMSMMPGGQPGPGGKTAPAKAKAKPAAEPKPKPKSESATVTRLADAQPRPAPEPATPAKAETAPAPAPEPEPTPAPEPETKAAAAPAPTAAEPAPAAEAGPAPSKPKSLMSEAPAAPDDLKMIRGIGPGLESKLNALGVYTFDQIAGFSTDDLVWIDENLTAFKGRCFRDDWVGQARSLTG
jgi:predicted flap endonuclease-1-like 5' DNA nuclease